LKLEVGGELNSCAGLKYLSDLISFVDTTTRNIFV